MERPDCQPQHATIRRLRVEKIRINLLHPTNSAEVMTASVPSDSTVGWLITEMVKHGFIPQADDVSKYRLRDTRTGVLLNDEQTLRAAHIEDGTSLSVNHTTTGALRPTCA
jgi:hypothetical protein